MPMFLVSIPFKREGVSGRRRSRGGISSEHSVSIPFKREGVSGLDRGYKTSERLVTTSFNSLQTGRCIWTDRGYKTSERLKPSFNSLQTGRCIWTRAKIRKNPPACFNSLQTGRCIWTTFTVSRGSTSVPLVSIPFKREGVSGPGHRAKTIKTPFKVSIPFKREGVSGPETAQTQEAAQETFQFPSNGKVYLDMDIRYASPGAFIAVSIPFKREGVSGHLNGTGEHRKDSCCFNSLQTGRCIWTSHLRCPGHLCHHRFNSLQTGRCIWTPLR